MTDAMFERVNAIIADAESKADKVSLTIAFADGEGNDFGIKLWDGRNKQIHALLKAGFKVSGIVVNNHTTPDDIHINKFAKV